MDREQSERRDPVDPNYTPHVIFGWNCGGAMRFDVVAVGPDRPRTCRRRILLHRGVVAQRRETDLRWPKVSTTRLNSAVVSIALDDACRAGPLAMLRIAAPTDGMSKEQPEGMESEIRGASGTP